MAKYVFGAIPYGTKVQSEHDVEISCGDLYAPFFLCLISV